MVEKRRYDSEEDSVDGEAAYEAPATQDSSSDDGVVILPKKGRVEESGSEEDLDSDDPDGEPTKKKKKVVAVKKSSASTTALATKKPRKSAAKKKEEVEEGGEKKVKKAKPKKDADGKNTRVVKVNTTVYPAPETDPETSIILPTTMQFLKELTKSENNDRDWFKARDPIYRHAETNWRAFIKGLVPVASRADWSLPELPVKDLVGRIYRDVRFSKDKRPYKTHLSVSMTRTGRKGIFAGYYLHIGHNKSVIAAGAYEISPTELSTIRQAIITDSAPLRKIFNAQKFTKVFGKAEVGEKGSIYGRDDELKTKPKIPGVGKDHKDIDLLKLKSFAVAKHLTNEEVLSPKFLETIYEILSVAAPFVQCLNEMILPTPHDDSEDGAVPPGSDAPEEEEGEGAEDSGEEVLIESSDDGKKGEGDEGDEEEEDD